MRSPSGIPGLAAVLAGLALISACATGHQQSGGTGTTGRGGSAPPAIDLLILRRPLKSVAMSLAPLVLIVVPFVIAARYAQEVVPGPLPGCCGA